MYRCNIFFHLKTELLSAEDACLFSLFLFGTFRTKLKYFCQQLTSSFNLSCRLPPFTLSHESSFLAKLVLSPFKRKTFPSGYISCRHLIDRWSVTVRSKLALCRQVKPQRMRLSNFFPCPIHFCTSWVLWAFFGEAEGNGGGSLTPSLATKSEMAIIIKPTPRVTSVCLMCLLTRLQKWVGGRWANQSPHFSTFLPLLFPSLQSSKSQLHFNINVHST